MAAPAENREIPETAIEACIKDMKQSTMGLTDAQWQEEAVSYISNVIEELQKYGATVTWDQK